MDKEQEFTISFQGKKVKGTCKFCTYKHKTMTTTFNQDYTLCKQKTTENKMEEGTTLTNLNGTTRLEGLDVYTVENTSLVVNGKKKSLPYCVKKRDFKIEYKVTYRRTKYVTGVSYSWPTKDSCYYGEIINSSVLTVFAVMSDGSRQTLEESDYSLSGINNKEEWGNTQTFYILYGNFSTSGTCRFRQAMCTEVISYKKKNGKTSSVSGMYPCSGGTQFKKKDYAKTITYGGKKYTRKSVSITVDGVGKSFPYTLGAREFDVSIACVYKEK